MDNSRFFGSEWKNTTRNWGNYLGDLQEDFKTCEDEKETLTLHMLISKASAARRVLSPIAANGCGSLRVVDAFDKEMNWLRQQDPAVPDPFPQCLKTKIWHTRAGNAWPASMFWRALRAEELHGAVTQDIVNGFQMELFPWQGLGDQ